MTKKSLATTSVIILSIFFLINTFYKDSFYEDLFIATNKSVFEPILVLVLGMFASSIFATTFNVKTFNLWYKKFFIWYLPLTLLLVFAFPTSGYALPYRFDVAVLFSFIMVFITMGVIIFSYFKSR